MPRDVYVTLVLNPIELIQLDTLCDAMHSKRATLLRNMLVDFLHLPVTEQDRRIDRGRTMAPRSPYIKDGQHKKVIENDSVV